MRLYGIMAELNTRIYFVKVASSFSLGKYSMEMMQFIYVGLLFISPPPNAENREIPSLTVRDIYK